MHAYADVLPDSQPGPVPDFASNTRPYLAKKVWKAPLGQESWVRDIEMLSGYEDQGPGSQPVNYGYVRITAEDAQRLAEAGGGFVEIGMVSSTVYPWSATVYADREVPAEVAEGFMDAAEDRVMEGKLRSDEEE